MLSAQVCAAQVACAPAVAALNTKKAVAEATATAVMRDSTTFCPKLTCSRQALMPGKHAAGVASEGHVTSAASKTDRSDRPHGACMVQTTDGQGVPGCPVEGVCPGWVAI